MRNVNIKTTIDFVLFLMYNKVELFHSRVGTNEIFAVSFIRQN